MVSVQKALISVITALLFFRADASVAQTPFWQETSGPEGGSIRAILITPDDVIYASAEGQGVFRSNDGGDSWVQSSHGLPIDIQIISLATDSTGILYAGTRGVGVFRSSDAGENWIQAITGLTNQYVYSLAVAPDQRILAGTNNGVVFHSTDQGSTWQGAAIPGVSGIYSLCLGPPEIIHAGTHQFGSESGYSVIYSSSDSGLTWAALAPAGGDGYVSQMAFVPPWTLFAAATNSGPAYGSVFGGSWSQQGGFFGTTSIAADEVGRVYLGVKSTAYSNGGVWRSLTGGSSWEPAMSGLYNLNVSVLASSASLGLYAGTSGGGIFKTVDRADYWQKVSGGLVATTVRGISCDPSGNVYATTTDFGLYRSTDRGGSWMHYSDGLNSGGLNFGPIATNPSGDVFLTLEDVLGGTPDASLYWSQDQGVSWSLLRDSPFVGAVTTLACNSRDHLFVANENRLYRTTDLGMSWTFTKVTDATAVSALAVSEGDTIYAGDVSGSVFRSSDNGMTWSQAFTVLIHDPIRALAVAETGTILSGTDSGLFISHTSGETWTRDTSITPGVAITAILRNPRGPLVAAAATGTYVSSDLGATWSNVFATSAPRQALSLAVDSAGYFYVGLQNGGVLHSTNSTTDADERDGSFVKSFALAQNYPNPFNPTTTIRYDLPRRSHVTLTVFNTLGQRVATLAEGEQEAGSHRARFDASGLSSGIYLYRLTADDHVLVRKLVVLR